MISVYACSVNSSLPRHGAATRAQPALLNLPWIVHQVSIADGWTEAVRIQNLLDRTPLTVRPHTPQFVWGEMKEVVF